MLLYQLAQVLQISPAPTADSTASENCTLNVDDILRTAVAAGLPAEQADALRKQAARFAELPLLAQYFNTLASALFGETLSTANLNVLPEKIGVLSEEEEYAFFGLLALSAIPSRRAAFAAAGFPEDSADGAVKDVFIWIDHFYRNRGIAGLSARIIGWDGGVLNGFPITLGRMQYILKKFHDNILVYRNTETGEVLALAGDGESFDRNGLSNVEDQPADPESWTAHLTVDDRSVTGNPVYPCGKADRTPVTLDSARWKLLFKQGDWTLDTHIPEGPDLTLDDCRESMTRALAFFRERHPDKEIKSFSCLSWLLDPQFEKLLKPESRILAWMRQYYLFPIPESGADSLWRIFGEDGLKNGLANAPRKTSMQKKIAEFLENGGALRSGGGFLLPDDLQYYGSAPYQQKRK